MLLQCIKDRLLERSKEIARPSNYLCFVLAVLRDKYLKITATLEARCVFGSFAMIKDLWTKMKSDKFFLDILTKQ